MINKRLSDEISIQDSVAGNYHNVRYKKKYSEEYQKRWFLTMVHLIRNKGLLLDNGCGVGYLAHFFPQARSSELTSPWECSGRHELKSPISCGETVSTCPSGI